MFAPGRGGGKLEEERYLLLLVFFVCRVLPVIFVGVNIITQSTKKILFKNIDEKKKKKKLLNKYFVSTCQ